MDVDRGGSDDRRQHKTPAQKEIDRPRNQDEEPSRGNSDRERGRGEARAAEKRHRKQHRPFSAKQQREERRRGYRRRPLHRGEHRVGEHIVASRSAHHAADRADRHVHQRGLQIGPSCRPEIDLVPHDETVLAVCARE